MKADGMGYYKRFRVKWVGRWDSDAKFLRLFRFVWRRGTPGLPGGGYSAKFSVALRPRVFQWCREWHEWSLTICGVRLHYLRSYGGIIP